MPIDTKLAHARRLFDLDRHEQACGLLLSHLGEHPDDADALTLLALAQAQLQRFDDAQGNAERAVEVAPTWSHAHHVLGAVLLERGDTKAAAVAAGEAIRLAPDDPDPFGLRAAIHAQQKRWKAALADADEGLRLDPEHDACTNLRGLALRQLGRGDESAQTLHRQLARTPTDALTHANQGWTLLQRGDHKGAITHFREALRLDPNSELAREGAKEALKARHWFYRPALRFLLWMNRFPPRTQFAILIGGYLVYRLAAHLSRQDGAVAALSRVVVVLYLAFCLLTWFASPIANSLLLFHPLGRLTLTRWERWGAITVSSLLAVAVACAVAGWIGNGPLLLIGLVLAFLCLPLRHMFDLDAVKARRGMAVFTGLAAMLAVACIVSAVQADRATRAMVAVQEPHPLQAEIDQYNAERARVQGREAVAELAARGRELRERVAAATERTKQEEAEQVRAVEAQWSVAGSMLLVHAILCVWVAQFVAIALAARAARR